jgi:hypothetical protein
MGVKNQYLRILSFFTFPAIVFFINIPLVFVYDLYPWFDIPMHFLGGFSIAFTSFLFLKFFKEKKILIIENKFLYLFIILAFVALVAVLWEFYEFFLDAFFNFNTIVSLEDTLLDLAMGLFGGFLGGLILDVN